MSTTAGDIIKGALRRIQSYMSGESIAAPDANDALVTLNDLLDSLSTDEASVYASVETIVNFTAGKYVYTIGTGGDFSVDAATGQPITRPVRVTNGYTRISNIDFPIDVTMDQNRYTEIGLKSVPSPWPIVAWYNSTWPLGTLSFYPNPASAGELHLFTDQILSNLPALTTVVSLPQGYNRALKWLLARELCIEYGFTTGGSIPPAIEKLARESMDVLKSINQVPAQVSSYDSALLALRNRGNAAWHLTGGMR